ncbi:hypothetical protein J2S64_002446 [Paeniglutamicibacter sulfureus]|uniref:Uncharacterized protein n=1 Tax=Paeniglutamicibacter sulfureus TaxID=43666 RepID=A0ABU2BJG7_9MICC|nr:hypothetical protein [Paeniglutamicibacter sulfureus]
MLNCLSVNRGNAKAGPTPRAIGVGPAVLVRQLLLPELVGEGVGQLALGGPEAE